MTKVFYPSEVSSHLSRCGKSAFRAALRSRIQALDSAGDSLTFLNAAASALPVLAGMRLLLGIRFFRGMAI